MFYVLIIYEFISQFQVINLKTKYKHDWRVETFVSICECSALCMVNKILPRHEFLLKQIKKSEKEEKKSQKRF